MATPPRSSHRATYFGMLLYAGLCLISMATMSIGAALLLACVAFDYCRDGGERPRGSHAMKFYGVSSAALILSCILSLASARFFPVEFGGAGVPVRWIQDLAKIWYFALPPALWLAWLKLSEAERGRVLRVWFIVFGLLSAMGVSQFFNGWPREQPNPMLPGYFHPILFLGHHLSVASVWIFPFFAILDFSFRKEGPSRIGLPRGVLLVFLILGAFVLIMTYSRTLWVGLPIGGAFWILSRFRWKTAVTAVVLLCLLGFGLAQSPIFQKRLQSRMGVDDRVELWKANLVFFEKRPILGVGFGKNLELSEKYLRWKYPEKNDYFVGHAHNVYLQQLAGTGILGLLVWLIWQAGVLSGIARGIRWEGAGLSGGLAFPRAALAAWVVLLINGATQVNFWEGKVLHQVMWMTGMILFWATSAERSLAADSAQFSSQESN